MSCSSHIRPRPCRHLGITSKPSSSIRPPWLLGRLARPASSFVPGSSHADNLPPPLPKPPSTNWFTTHPELTDSTDSLDSLIHRSRQHLHRIGVLKRYSAPPDFSGTAIRLKWLKWKMATAEDQQDQTPSSSDTQLTKLLWNKDVRWHRLPVMSILLQPNQTRQLRMIEYDNVVSKLNELKNLKKYLMMLKTLELSYDSDIQELDSQIDQVLLKFSQQEKSLNEVKKKQIERDHLGRFYGLGRKKESTARAWMIEPQIPEAISDQTSSSHPQNSNPTITTAQASTHPQPEINLDPLPLGKINVNGKSIVDYFHNPRQRATAIRPLEITNCVGHYNIHVLTHGGGKMGQAAAISHAIANALMKALQEASKNTDGTAKERYAKKVLAKSSLTLRDPRVVERKKTGKPGAKSSYRWVKR